MDLEPLKVLFLTRHGRLGASSRVRTLHYADFFRRNGVHCEISAFADDSMLAQFYDRRRRSPFAYASAILKRCRTLRTCSRYDLLWIQKELFPYLPAFAEKWLQSRGVPYVVDYDDAVFHNYDQHPNPIVRKLLRRKIARVMSFSDCVLAGNSYLAEYARNAGATRIELIPTVVDSDRYFPKSKPDRSEIIVGWIGSPVTSSYLQLLRDVLPLLAPSSRLRFVAIGASAEKLADLPIRICNWSEETEVEQVQDFDIGIMPLLDRPGERGKCGYKLIQYMACGLPVIASPVGVNCEIVRHGINGFLATTPQEWADALDQLENDPQLRQKMGAAGRLSAEKNYSNQVIGPKILSILRSVARERSPDAIFRADSSLRSNTMAELR